ncbi:lipase secretion chaperone [Simplicispira hankyongi]|uniref:Lipase helper protein n=1 Tax=Simplicispira hankyongi TaxID=2315688 RepID=A0A398C7Q6_9BURK|nr:lipase secretion chaperone [Simplicispira hankyongi]RID97267.1 lipase chaperone [Simplicispira hankyongi]
MKGRAIALVCAAAVLAAGAWWLIPQGTGVLTPQSPGHAPAGVRLAQPMHGPSAAPPDALARPSNAVDPLLAPGLRDELEAMLLEAGNMPDPQALKRRLAELVARRFGEALSTRALALAERYVDYRVALGELKPPEDATDPRALRDVLQARDALRRQYFDESEFDALFADQQALDRYTLARLEIERNPDLTAEQRRQALAGTETELDPQQRAERAQSVVQEAVGAQTAAFNAAGTDDRTRFAQRSARFGEDAAQRLAQLDAQDRDWNARLDDYARAQASQTDANALAQLRERSFTPQEQLRLDAALALRAVSVH